MPLYNIFNARMVKVDYVQATDDADALQHARRIYPGAAVQRVLTRQQQQQKEYDDQVSIWEETQPRWRQR